jgi:predicted transcriptional regulator
MSYIPKIDEFEKFRKKLGIEQKELAKAIGVSTNMISQIETKRAKPSADNYKKIIDYFYQKSDKNELILEQIWATPVIFLTPRQSAQKAKEYFDSTLDIDVLPVLNNKEDKLPLGKVSRTSFENYFEKNHDLQDVTVNDILEEAPPTFPYDTPKTWIRPILQVRNSCVLVAKDNKISGIVNYWDYFSK